MRSSRTDISKHARNNMYIYIYIYVLSMGRKEPSSTRIDDGNVTQRGFTAQDARKGGGKERRRVVIRYLGGGEGRLCQQLSGNGLALQITFCVNVLTYRWLDYTQRSRAKLSSFFVASNSRFPSCSFSSSILLILTTREQDSTTGTMTRLFGQRNQTRRRDSRRKQSDKQLWKLRSSA